MLQGGGAVGDVADNATAFGCRDWDFACVITAVRPRNESGTNVAQAAIQWVYSVARSLLPLSSGVYGADLGPDPRDTALAAKAFGPNGPRLAQLKHSLDVHNVLAYACPLSKLPKKQKLIILVTGESGVGKDYCADVWVPMLARSADQPREVHKASISDAIKREYAAATGADLDGLLGDRAYKEQHRPALTTFFKEQMRKQPWLLEKQFLNVVSGAADADVLVITGMRDEAPTATLSHLVPNSRLLDIRVTASEKTRQTRRKCQAGDDDRQDSHDCEDDNSSDNGSNCKSNSTTLDYCPSLVFDNGATADEAVRRFADTYLLPFLHGDLERLASMVLPVPDFPRPGIEFRHVLNIAQQQGGLALCTSLLQTHFINDWDKIDPSSVAADLYNENEDSDDGLYGHASEETYDDIYLDTANNSTYNLNEDNNTSNRVEDFKIIHSSVQNEALSRNAAERLTSTTSSPDFTAQQAMSIFQRRFTMDYGRGGTGSKRASDKDNYFPIFHLDMISIAPYSSKHAVSSLPFDLTNRTFRLGTGSTREVWFVVMHPMQNDMFELPHSRAELRRQKDATYIKQVFLLGDLLGEGAEPSWRLGERRSQHLTGDKWTSFQDFFMEGWSSFA
ncbi:hypothetical protein TGAM01_v210516 [Trichoderma gamsii]|uniref:Phosphomevalonate kinase n=1 Tax=Trichoderma gamsii TaxID=398673 RepID=A0A2P4Z8N8_9HYPO|nr:hypothetical protein TGAM01_v210516 [Trichoderma gamsii]PON20642.1 hypothetical protein TGAM01_v210516 [Trichoderma gamsii]